MMPAAVTSFLDDLRRTDIGKAIFRDRAAKAHAERQTLLEQLDALERDRPATAESQDRLLRPLVQAAEAAKTKHLAAAAKVAEAQRTRASALYVIDSQITRLTNELQASADPRIEQARASMEARWERARGTLGQSVEIRLPQTSHSGKSATRIVSNSRALRRVLDAVKAARLALERLKFQNPADLDATITAILAPVDDAYEHAGEFDEPGFAA